MFFLKSIDASFSISLHLNITRLVAMDHPSTEMFFASEAYSQEFLIDLYKKLLKPRLVEEKMLILLRQGKISNSDHVNDVLIPSTVVPTWLRFHLQRVNIIGDYFASPICP